jgi:uncharacterized protein (DUF58 family)
MMPGSATLSRPGGANLRSIKLTPDGLSLLAAQAVVFFAAFNTGANLVYVIASMILSLFLVSLFYAIKRFRGLAGHLTLPVEVPEGQPFPYRVTLANPTGATEFLLRVSPRFARAVGAASLPVFRLDPGTRIELTGTLTLPMRGAYATRGLAVESVYPCGLLAREEVLPAASEVVVLPAPLKHPFPLWAGFNQRALWAETGSNIKGEGSAFFGLREYVPGDPIRKIHWRATARQGRPMVVEDEEDRVNRYYVFVDLRESRKVGEGRTCNLEVSIRIAASLTMQLLKLNCPVRVHLLDEQLSPSPQSFTALDIPAAMRFLGRLGYSHDADFAQNVHRLLPEIPPGSFLLFVLNGVDPDSIALVERLRRSNYSLFCLFNLADAAAVETARQDPAVRALVRTDVQTMFFDASEERVVAR